MPETVTVSIAVPGCILDKAQTPLLKAYLAGQISRAAIIFKVDQIVIFSESGCRIPSVESKSKDPSLVLYRLLRFLETPPYLRKDLFPLDEDYKYVAAIKPVESIHHPLIGEKRKYREGVVKKTKGGKSWVEVGLKDLVKISKELEIKKRVTVEFKEEKKPKIAKERRKRGYQGYTLRLANDVKKVINECPFKNGYDLIIGTSENGEPLKGILNKEKKFKNLLIVFGGPKGLENCRNTMRQKLNMKKLFPNYINAGIDQGSRTIRTEEAVLIVMGAMNEFILNSRNQ